jgi:hypothetical protein
MSRAGARVPWGEGVHRVLLCEAIPCDLEQRPTAWLSQRRLGAGSKANMDRDGRIST